MITIIDYGAGNLRSVQKALEKLGFPAQLTKDKNLIRSSKGVILPGVGSFDAAITELRNHTLEMAIEEVIALGKPFLGICLGYQMLFEESEEGRQKGFGILKGKVKKFDFKDQPFSHLTVPQMGWNRLLIKHKSALTEGLSDGSWVYFAHSYYPSPSNSDIILTETDYGINFASSVSKGFIFGVQFHPEKSGKVGLKILENFGKLCSK